jgi:uncharacterized protein YcfJ
MSSKEVYSLLSKKLVSMKGNTMKKFILAAVGVFFATTATAQANEYATVTAVKPIYSTVSRPITEQQCNVVEVPIYGQGQMNQDGAIIGGIVGGLLGNTIGKGSGKTAATGVGAMAGAIIGGKGDKQVVGYRQEQRCNNITRYEQSEELKYYKVQYEWNGVYGTTSMARPVSVGQQIPVTVSINAR